MEPDVHARTAGRVRDVVRWTSPSAGGDPWFTAPMSEVELLAERLEAAGFEVASLDAVKDGSVCAASMAALHDGRRLFAKTQAEPDMDTDLFEVEADGLSALGELGGARVPAVIHVSPCLLVLEELRPRGEGERFWEQLGRMIAGLHTSTVSDRFGWHRDGRHGPGGMRQDNSWETDGHAFYARHRILRWLPEPRVEAEFDRAERRAVERLCAALPELIPPHPASLTHGDLWIGNILTWGAADIVRKLIAPFRHHTASSSGTA